FILESFSDSDYAGASLDRKSTTEGCQFLGSRLISCQCKKQTVVANSTTEAEYITASHCCGQLLWIQNQMLDYGYNFMHIKIHVDNESAICVIKNPVYHSKTKHMEIRHHFIRDSYEKRLIEMVKIHTNNNVADLLTKAFDGRLVVYKCSGLYTSAIWIEVGSYFDDLNYFKDFENEFSAIVYNDAPTSKSDFLTKPILSPQHIDEFDLKSETSLSEYNEEEQNVLCFNDLFPFNIIYPHDLKSDKENDDDKINIEHSSGDLSVKPLPDVINTNVGVYAHGLNKLLETSHDCNIREFSNLV
ncbi:hypothetical protein Tco_1206355, partial [Tanacetum coccineum]